jgi:hypothetical protein
VIGVTDYREVKRETAELYVPEPGFRIRYYGPVVKVERVIPRVKPVRIHGIVRYGAIQIILPRDCVDKPAYVIVYILSDKEKLGSESQLSSERPEDRSRNPLIRVIN